jgi:hypothetical protein
MSYTCIFPEDQCCGMWRLQTDDPALIERMQRRTYQGESPWKVVGRGDIWIFRRSFANSSKAKQHLERTLMGMDENPIKLSPIRDWKGWEALRPSE